MPTMKPCYADYVANSLRYYARVTLAKAKPRFRAEFEKLNWDACKAVDDTLSELEHDNLITIYAVYDADHMHDAIADVANARGVSVDNVRAFVKRIEHQAAVLRGLTS